MENKSTIADKKKLLVEVNAKIRELDELNEVEDLIQNNTIEFDFENEDYRVKKPGRKERAEIREAKNKKKIELIRDPKNVTENELIKLYLNRDVPVDIAKMESNIKGIQNNINILAIDLIETQNDSERKRLEEELNDLQIEQLEISSTISELLDSCIEKQLKDFIQEYLIYMCLEKLIDGNWNRYYESYESFMNTNDKKDDDLLYKATYYFATLMNKNEI